MSLESDIDVLSRVSLFADLNGDQLRLLAFSAVRHRLEAGQILFRRGDDAGSGYVVTSGAIALSVVKGRGETQTCGPGYLIGEMALFIATKRPATATAADTAQLIEITRELMRRMLDERPEVAVLMHRRMAARLQATILDLKRVREALLTRGE